jgi:hypothetical protein
MDIGAPPAGDDPEAQVEYLIRVVTAFQATGNPRIKPLRKRLDTMLERLAEGGERLAPEDEEGIQELATELATEVHGLQRQTYDLLLTVINQTRATLRVKLKQGMPPNERVDTEKLQKSLAAFAQGLRKMLVAAKKGDKQAHDEAARELEAAGRLLDETAGELEG